MHSILDMTTWRGRLTAILASAILLAASAVGKRALAEAPPRGASAAQAGQKLPSSHPPAFVVAGAPRERGVAYGRQFREGIRTFLEQEIYEPFAGKPASKEEMLRYAAACGAAAREVCPLVVEEHEGIAAGAGVSFDEIVLMSLHEELYHRSKLPAIGHCTAVAVSPSDSGDGQAYVGQTWDWMTRLAGVSSVVEWRRDDGPSVLGYGYPGLPMGAGMNSQGIALCWTSAALGKTAKQSPRVGVPSYMLICHLLAQSDLPSVIREAKRDKHAGWFTFVMADGAGNLASIEGSPTGIAVEEPKDRLARVSFGTRAMAAPKPGDAAELHPRCRQMYKLLGQTAGRNNRSTLEQYFTERESEIVAWKSAGNKTIDVMLFDTTARKAYVSRGPEYGLEWREFGFSAADSAAGAASR